MGRNWAGFLGCICILALLLPTAALAQGDTPYQRETAVATATAIVRPSVVAVETRFDEPRVDDDFMYWQAMMGPRPLHGLWGTGFVYKDPQYVITCSFITQHAEYIRVVLDDGRAFAATLVGENKAFSTAVLKVDWGPDLEPVAPVLADSDKLRLGQPIALVGKALNTVDTHATAGIISAVRKEITGSPEPTDQYLQFDASFEQTYTGAPIVDVYGKIVGMVRETAGIGLNLGIPINEITRIADKLIAGETTEIWFGVEKQIIRTGIQDAGLAPATFDWNGDGKMEKVDFGMWISFIEPNSPADVAGLKAGDTIVELDDKFLKYEYDWGNFVRDMKVGQLVTVKFIRKNEASGKWERMETQVQILAKPGSEDDKDSEGSNLPPGHPAV